MATVWSLVALLGCSESFSAAGLAAGGAPTPGDDAAGDDSGVDTAGSDTAAADDDSGEVAEGDWPSACTSWAEPEQTGTVVDGSLDELSGVAASWRNPGVLWVLEDHAGPNTVFGLDPSGATVASITLETTTNNDWESLAVGPCGDTTCIFVGDIGDNDHDRPWHGVLRIPEPEVLEDSTLTLAITPDIFPYVFPDGAWDSEGMAVLPDGRPVLFSKEYDTAQTSAYAFPILVPDSTTTLEYLGRFSTGVDGDTGAAAVTGADLWPDGERLILRTYGHIWEFPLSDGDLSTVDAAARVERSTGEERQGEAISYDPIARTFVTVSEGVNPPLWRVGCAD